MTAAPERITPADFWALVGSLPAFWGERDARALHHPMFLHEFGDTALMLREDGEIVAYLLGFVASVERVGYVHVVGVRETHRRRGLARALYAAFAELARERGAVGLKAITQAANTGSIAFHRALGWTATEVPDYSGPGEMRVVLRRALEDVRA